MPNSLVSPNISRLGQKAETDFATRQAKPRLHYLDYLRTTMTVVVIVAHAMMTYGGDGSWFYRELGTSRSPTSVFFTLFVLTNQAFLMGFFFLIAGFFTPSSIDRHGARGFLIQRLLRLGVPLLFFGVVLGPLTVAMVNAATGGSFQASITSIWRNKEFINGPTWFDEALLFMSFGYALWRWVSVTVLRRKLPSPGRNQSSLPGNSTWLLAALGVGLAAFLLRLVFPVDRQTIGLWIGYFASYILLFAAGVAAWRGSWLPQLTWKQTRLWLGIAILVWPSLPLAYAVVRARHLAVNFAGGISWASLLYSFWEPFLAWGVIASFLMLFQVRFNRPSAFGNWMSRRAYAAYVLHAPVLTAVCLLLRSWHAPPAAKCFTAALLACCATWLIADPLVRIPGLRRFV